MKKPFLFVSIFIFIPFFSYAQQNCPNCFTDQGSCVNGTCQPRRCGDGVCNDCSYAFSPCIAQETSSSCPQDCKSTTPTPTPTPQFKETDSGKDYYLKGITTGYEAFSEKIPPNILNKEDHCSATCFGNAEQNKTAQGPCLIEYFLDPNQYANYETVACENGCAEGVCVKKGCAINNSAEITEGTSIKYDYICTQRCDKAGTSYYVPEEKRYMTWNYPEYFDNPPEVMYFKIKVPDEGCPQTGRAEFWLSGMSTVDDKAPKCGIMEGETSGGNMLVAYPGYDFKTEDNAMKIYNESLASFRAKTAERLRIQKEKGLSGNAEVNAIKPYSLGPPYRYSFSDCMGNESMMVMDINNYKGQYFYVMVRRDYPLNKVRVSAYCY